MFNFFKDKKDENGNNLLSKIGSLLIHIAKIDEKYTAKEREIISKTLIELGAEQKELESLLNNAEKNEENANQILDFTKEIKNIDEKSKKKIIEALWTVVFSDGSSDMYEESLMRRLSGLLYLDNKIVGNIKEEIKNRVKK